MAVKKPVPGTAVKKWDEKLAEYAAAAAKTEEAVGLGKFLSLKSGVLTYNGNAVPGNKLNCIVVNAVLENQYYEGAFDPNNPSSPVCFAFGYEDKEMAPHEKSTKPQNEKCKGCPQNEYGTADVGKGKACKNVRRLGLITEEGLEDLENAEMVYVKIPVMSVKPWAGYVDQLMKTMGRPPFAVVTEINVVPDAKSQFRVGFKYVSAIEDGAVLEQLEAKMLAGKETIMFPYQPIEREPAPAPSKKLAPQTGRVRR